VGVERGPVTSDPAALRNLVDVERDGSLVLAVHVQPGAARTGLAGRHGDALKLRVTAPPVEGRANEAARTALAEALGLRRSQVELVSGASSRRKRFRLTGLTLDDLTHRLRPFIANGH
jgi:uncharacterized protein